jgi:hypothetical protein
LAKIASFFSPRTAPHEALAPADPKPSGTNLSQSLTKVFSPQRLLSLIRALEGAARNNKISFLSVQWYLMLWFGYRLASRAYSVEILSLL